MQESPMRFIKDLPRRLRIDLAALHRVDEGRRALEKRLVAEAERLISECAAFASTPTGDRTAVIGLAANYGIPELTPFVRSLRDSGYAGDIVLLTYGCSSETAAFLRHHNVRMVPFTSLGAMAMSMNSARMFRYLDWLLEQYLNAPDGVAYNRLLLADVRDVVFQGDPFRQAPPGRVLFFLESRRTLGTCPINADWMTRAYGEAALRELANQPVSCAGTIMGTPDGLLEYLALMVRDLVAVPPQHRFSGVDQAVHNYILGKGLLNGAVAVPNGASVMTVASEPPTGVQLDAASRIVNDDGRISEVVHQYDRDPMVLAAVAARYGLTI